MWLCTVYSGREGDKACLHSKTPAQGHQNHPTVLKIGACYCIWITLSKDDLLKSRDITWPTKVHLVSYAFSSGHIWMWELDHKENWALKNWYFWTVMLEKTLESPLDCKEIQAVHPKRNQSWMFFGRTDTEAETPILWPPDAKNWVTGKDFDAGKNWRQEKKGTTEDEIVGWHHRPDGHEFE